MNVTLMSGYIATEPTFNTFPKKKKRRGDTRKKGMAANFRISVKRGYMGKDGQKYDYFSCSAYDDSAKYIRRYIQEGDYVLIRAVLKNNNYEDEDGEMVYRDVLVIERIELIRERNDEEDSDYDEDEFYDDYEEDDEEEDYDEDYDEEDDEEDEEDEEEYEEDLPKSRKRGGTSTRRRRRPAERKTADRNKRKSGSVKHKEVKRNVSRKKPSSKREKVVGLNERKSREIDDEFETLGEEEDNFGFD